MSIRSLLLLWRAHWLERPFRSLLMVLGVALGVSAFVAVRTANVDVLQEFEQAVLSVTGSATLEATGGDLGFDEEVLALLQRVPEVVAATPVIEQVVRIAGASAGTHTAILTGLDLLQEEEAMTFRVETVADATEALDILLEPDSVYVGRRLAEELHLDPGSRLPVVVGGHVHDLRVRGFLGNKGEQRAVWEHRLVMDIAAAQKLLGMTGRVDRILITTAPGRSVIDVAAELRELVPASVRIERPTRRTEQVEGMVRAFQMNLSMLSGVGLLVAVFLIYNTVSFGVAQRRREIGIYSALGMRRPMVVGLFLFEAAILGLLGGLAGGVFGVILAKSLTQMMNRTVAELYVNLNEIGGGISHEIIARFLAEGMLVGIGVSLLGAFAPSLDAGRTQTVQALAPGSYEAVQEGRTKLLAFVGCLLLAAALALSFGKPAGDVPVFGYLASLGLLAGLSCLVPALIQAISRFGARGEPRTGSGLARSLRHMALSHLGRTPGRHGVTVSALMIGIAIMVGVAIMVRSFRHTVEVWIDETVLADVIIAPTTWLTGAQAGKVANTLPADWEAAIRQVGGVAAVDSYRDLRVEIKGRSVALVSRDLRLHAERSQYLIRRGDPKTVLTEAAETDGVLVSEVLANKVGVKEGDRVTLDTPSGPASFRILGVFYDYATDGGKIVMDRELYRRLWKDEGVTVFPLYLVPGASLEEVRKEIALRLDQETDEGGRPILVSNRELRAEILRIFDRTFALTYVLEGIAVVIAVLGIVNTLVISVIERQRELATFRALGASDGQVKSLIFWEAVYLGAIGALAGVGGGLLLSLLLIHVINKQSFGWTIQTMIPLSVLAEAVILALGAALVAGYWPARWAVRQPVVEGLRYE